MRLDGEAVFLADPLLLLAAAALTFFVDLALVALFTACFLALFWALALALVATFF